MAEKSKTKLKLLYIKDYLEKISDENRPVSTEEFIEMLKAHGITCERKSIYSDIQTLRDYNLEIFRVKTPSNGYYFNSREFELPEVRLLIDAVQSASFITAKKTKELIKKISTLCSVGQAKVLQKQVYIENRVKCTNEEIYYNIDVINNAISAEKQISFIYLKRTLDDESKGVKLEEKQFTVSPYALIWSNDHYYLVSNNAKYNNLMHTRIDRMKKVEMLTAKARQFSDVSPYKSFFDSADYSGKLFNMFSGDTQQLEFVCNNAIVEEIIDRFGSGAEITKCIDDEHFRVKAKGVVSDGLVSWIMQFSDNIEVIGPLSLRDKIRKRAEEIYKLYSAESMIYAPQTGK